MSKNNLPMWGNNEWTKSMFKKYWLVIIFYSDWMLFNCNK